MKERFIPDIIAIKPKPCHRFATTSPEVLRSRAMPLLHDRSRKNILMFAAVPDQQEQCL